jgi:uncharacterized membrane protein
VVNKKKASTAKKEGNLKALLTYAAGWITGLIFLLIEKEDEFIRFNAAQSVVVFGGINLIMLIPFVQILTIFLWPLSLILWIVLMVKAYNNERLELPVVADLAKQLEKKLQPQS